jgi:hypothetical protein
MKQNPYILWVARDAILLSIAGFVLLVAFLPMVAAVIFVVIVSFLAVARSRTDGFWNGVKFFVKQILFGW